jgi:hypothetical protein
VERSGAHPTNLDRATATFVIVRVGFQPHIGTKDEWDHDLGRAQVVFPGDTTMNGLYGGPAA